MRIPLKKIGNSRGILIPAKILSELGWDEGMELELTLKDQNLQLRKALPSFDEMIRSVKNGAKANSSRLKEREGEL